MASSAFTSLLRDIRNCQECVQNPGRRGPLPHQPRPVVRGLPSAKICIVGQAPGTRVHKSGIPFDDPSGDRLREWLGVPRDVFYDETKFSIIPMGFCFPGLDAKGGDLPPRTECAPKWRDQLLSHFDSIELLLVIGAYAQKWHLGEARKKTVTETVAAWQEYVPDALPLPHPSWRNTAWLKKNPWFEKDVLPYLRDRVASLT